MNQSTSYKENYDKLRQIAERLDQPDELDIDELVPLVDEAAQAYQACKKRIEAVEKALNAKLDQLEPNDHD
ncbi:MAG TPA: exodeoxyribonuclease VII small subunit [Piscirickettsiaceae bacterium]|nr:exodeoxyribonuclease VII small subunit [Piscirickettsiaceae bacterium]